IGTGVVIGGGDVARPFTGSIAYTLPTAAHGSLVLYATSAKDGSVVEATAIRLTFARTAPCSAAEAGLSPDVAPDASLPAAVDAMRRDLARAAATCDYGTLATLIDRDGKGVRFSFGAE